MATVQDKTLDNLSAVASLTTTDLFYVSRSPHTGEATSLKCTADKLVWATSSTDNRIARFDGTAGQIQSSGVTIDDSNNISGVVRLNLNSLALGSTYSAQTPADGVALFSTQVVIGATSGTKPLEVAASGGIAIARTDTGSNNELYFSDNGQIRSSDSAHRIVFDRANNIFDIIEYGDIILSSGATSGTRNNSAKLTASGNLLVGTTSDLNKLAVAGSACFGSTFVSNLISSNSVAIEGNLGVGIVSAGAKTDILSTSTQLRLTNTTTGSKWTNFAVDTSGNLTITPVSSVTVTGSGVYTEALSLVKTGNTGSVTLNLDNNNATKIHTGVNFKRQGSEKGFFGLDDTTDSIRLRMSASFDAVVFSQTDGDATFSGAISLSGNLTGPNGLFSTLARGATVIAGTTATSIPDSVALLGVRSAGGAAFWSTASNINWMNICAPSGVGDAQILFGAYFDGAAIKSSTSTANYKIHGSSTTLKLSYASGVSYTSSITWTDGIILNTSGQVGINKASPDSGVMLHVRGTSGTSRILTESFSDANKLAIGSHDNGTDSGAAFIFQQANKDLSIGTNNTERVRIYNTGYVRIMSGLNVSTSSHLTDNLLEVGTRLGSASGFAAILCNSTYGLNIQTNSTASQSLIVDNYATFSSNPHSLWRQNLGSSAATLFTIRQDGLVYAGNATTIGTTHESNRATEEAQMYNRGFAWSDGTAFQGGVTGGISLAGTRSTPIISVNQNGSGDIAAFYADTNANFRFLPGSYFFISNSGGDPTTPSSHGAIYLKSGALYYRGPSSGTVSNVAPA